MCISVQITIFAHKYALNSSWLTAGKLVTVDLSGEES